MMAGQSMRSVTVLAKSTRVRSSVEYAQCILKRRLVSEKELDFKLTDFLPNKDCLNLKSLFEMERTKILSLRKVFFPYTIQWKGIS